MSATAMDMFWHAPPLSRTLTAALLTLSILVHTSILPIRYVVCYIPYLQESPYQLWRIFTSFLITGPKLGILFDTYFLYTHGSKLETSSPRFSKPGEFFTYVAFLWVTILGLNVLFTGGYMFTEALILAFVYTSSQDDRGQKANLFFITMPAPWLPFAMILVTLVTSGLDAAIIQGTGLVAAHLHDFLTRIWPTFGGGRNLLPTPDFVKRWSMVLDNHTTASAPTGSASASGSSADNVLPESWRNRGSGHRLGGD